MKIQLINGQFTAEETISLISKMTAVKIQFLENKISNSDQEEDIKSKEAKIITLQNNLSKLRESTFLSINMASLNCNIEISM